ncbi:DUF1648 domain-containing protein [Alteribacter natronophilus]|uniref:DUF1648 domain-containing protein n=1 Tax=Alteribacter natronophilus TaxID=2583810 RepID=UPI00110EB88E|nr:DUF1648 domain-containing protein [Alteribacter natronophilus]TMW72948.1 DUF1648 domain-containing protein [Alteribacter natronophilus]
MKRKDRLLLAAAAAVATAMIIMTIVSWDSMPGGAPGHINHLGEVTSWASKPFIFFVPGMALFLMVVMIPAYYFPAMVSIPVRATLEEKEQLQDILGSFLLKGLLVMQLMFFWMQYQSILLAAGEAERAVMWPAAAFLAAVFLITAADMKKVKTRLREIRSEDSEK